MAIAYVTERAAQRQRRELLGQIRERLGERLFANFIIDVIATYGPLEVGNLPALVDVWLLKQRLAA